MTSGAGGVLEDLLIDHNTAIPGGHSAYYIDTRTPPAMNRLRLTNNLISFGAYGVTSPRPVATWFPGSTIARNALVSMADTGDGQGSVAQPAT